MPENNHTRPRGSKYSVLECLPGVVSSGQLGPHPFTKWVPLINLYHAASFIIYVALSVKCTVLVLLKYKQFERLKWLDCYLHGRTMLGSRILEANHYIALMIMMFFIAHKLKLLRVNPSLNLYCLEFACFNHKQISPSLFSKRPPAARLNREGGLARKAAQSEQIPIKQPPLGGYFLNQLHKHRPQSATDLPIIYPQLTLLAETAAFIIYWSLLLFNVWVFGPLVLTRRGFELVRKECVRTILIESAAAIKCGQTCRGPKWYESIYVPDPAKDQAEIFNSGPVSLVLPYDAMVPLNLYHVVRVAFDILELYIIWCGLWFNYLYQIYYSVIFSVDTNNYVINLRKQVDELAEKLRNESSKLEPLREESMGQTQPAIVSRPLTGGADEQARAVPNYQSDSITDLQASILDCFNCIALYNPYIALTALINVIIWIFYTFLIFVRILRVDRLETVARLDHGIQLEYALLFGWCLLIVMVELAAAAILDSQTRQLYRSMTVVMALDTSVTKRHWITLLKYFEPKNLNCFTFFNHISISWLFCMKVSAPNMSFQPIALLKHFESDNSQSQSSNQLTHMAPYHRHQIKLISWVISALVILKSL